MAKRLCDPTSGKVGNVVYQGGRNGQILRTRAIPSNPRSSAQRTAREHLATESRAWDSLTEVQRQAWIAAAKDYQSKSRLGMRGTLTGNQFFVKVNATLLAIGSTPVTEPPEQPTLTPVPVDALSITNTGGTIAIRVHTTGSPADGTILRAAAPVKAGVSRTPDTVMLGTLDSPVNNYVVITTAYTSRFGVPNVGQKIFVEVVGQVDGIEDIPLAFSAIVPASS